MTPDPTAHTPDPALAKADFLSLIPRDFAREHGLLSQGITDGTSILAITAATSPDAVWNTAVRLGQPVATCLADPEALHRAIDSAYERTSNVAAETSPDHETTGHVISEITGEEDLDSLLAEADKDLLATEGKAPLVRLMDRLLFTAVQRGASDLHIQPTVDGVIIRHRVDGVLDQGRPLPRPSSARSSAASRSWGAWTWPNVWCLRMDAPRYASATAPSTCASPPFPPPTANGWCCVCWTVPAN